MSQFDPEIIKGIRECIRCGDIIDAMLFASRMFELTRSESTFNHICSIANNEGGYDDTLMEVLNLRSVQVMRFAKQNLTFDEFQEFFDAFKEPEKFM